VSLTELIQKIHELSPEEQEIIRHELDGLHQEEFETTPEMLAAIDEGLRSSREEGTIPIEDVIKEISTWNTKSP
jgi:predicted transcriptional regulator